MYYEGDYEGPGWCLVCFRKRCWFKKAGSRMSELAIKKWVQPHDPIAGIIYCYVAGDLTKDIKEEQRWAKISAWQHFLVVNPVWEWRETRFGRLAVDYDLYDEKDEEENDDWEIVPDFLNPMHKLMWSVETAGAMDITFDITKPFKVIVEFIGAPDFNCMFHS